MSARLPHVLFAAYLILCLLALIWPGYALVGNRIEPYVLGVPFSFAWVILWILLTFGALVLYHAATHREE